MRHVPLRYAARMTALMADVKHPRYEAAARELIVVFTEDLRPPPIQIKKLADALAHVHHHYYGVFARDGLQDLIRQLHQERRPVEINFDSLANERRQSRA